MVINLNFNPRSPCGERHRPGGGGVRREHFNPRSPRGERRNGICELLALYSFQSTLPAWGATNFSATVSRFVRFQSTLPVWGATLLPGSVMIFLSFQSTLPVWGATTSCLTHSQPLYDFNPRSPCGERLEAYVQCGDWLPISIHAPRVGSDVTNPDSRLQLPISIHAPRVGSDSRLGVIDGSILISIHAPRVGSDHGFSRPGAVGGYFNPRSPCGERLLVATAFRSTSLFQSTLPVWGATSCSIGGSSDRMISIHAPRVGSDDKSSASRSDRRHFNPRSPCGERPPKIA